MSVSYFLLLFYYYIKTKYKLFICLWTPNFPGNVSMMQGTP